MPVTADRNQPLKDHVAIVTGAGSGIGRATARALAAAGAAVVVNDLAVQGAQACSVVEEIQNDGGRAIVIEADIAHEAQIDALFARTVDHFGTVHILVNNAGIQRDSAFPDMRLQQWEQVIDVNLTGHFLCARAAVREFVRRGPCENVSRAMGKIVFVSSVHQIIPWARHANYAASKGGVMLLMKTLAQEVAAKRIRVNAVAPGAIRTPINRAAWENDAALAELLKLIPYGRIGDPDDVAQAITWLASDESDYITGSTLVIDGGMQLYPGFREGAG